MCSPIFDAMEANFYLRRFIRSVAASVILCFLAMPAVAQQPTIRFARNPDPAPEFKLADLAEKPISLADFRSKVVLLNFWATWCGPCRAEIPDLVELQKKYSDRLQIIGLVVDDDDVDEIKKFMTEFGINYPIAVTTDEIRMQYGGIAALPTSFVIDAEGRVVQKHEGLRNPALYEVEIRSLLGLPTGNVKVETFEDTGEIFLKHADRASQLPGVDLSKLTQEQKTTALHKFNAEMCTCGCEYTLAQCRIWDRNCKVSEAATAKIVAAIISPKHPASATADPPAPSQRATPQAAAAPKKPAAPERPRN
jgi:thiol-disulfide isomerase/thioredoxin